jgi:hypothetical protein
MIRKQHKDSIIKKKNTMMLTIGGVSQNDGAARFLKDIMVEGVG